MIRDKNIKRTFIKIIKWTLLLIFLATLTFGGYIGIRLLKIRGLAQELIEEKGSEAFRESLTTLVYDVDNNQIAQLRSDKDAYYIEYDLIPYMVKEIFLITEDRSFYDHGGVDYKSILRAVIAYIENDGEITQGGSTITQQLARNVYLSHEVSMERKLKEIFIAWELEDIYSKDEILEFYINDIYFANGLYGIQAAARGYFSRDVGELTLSQLCFICAIPNNPETYNPLENMDNTLARRDRILKQLLDNKIIDRSQYEEAFAEKIVLETGEAVKHNYVETFVRYCATRELMELNGFQFRYFFNSDEEKDAYTEEYNIQYGKYNSMLFTGGYRIYTSIDMDLQAALQEAINNHLSSESSVNGEGVYQLQGSGVSIDNRTGYVVAVVGGREQSEQSGYTLNRAYQSFRQPGSAIKPILTYTPLFEREYTPDTIVADEKIPGGPTNSPNVYSGDITIRTALALSKNTVAWNMFELMGRRYCMSYLLNMGFSHIVESDYVPAMSIGGMTYGVSALEMASAYGALANYGIYRKPTCIVKIMDSFGNILVDNGAANMDSKVIYEKNASLTTTSILKNVLEWGTGAQYQIENGICAGKTGTTNDNKDVWFVGYSKYYTTAVWSGYDMPKTLEGQLVRSSGYIWKSYMEEIHRDLEEQDFEDYTKTEEEGQEEPTLEDITSEDITEEETIPEETGESIYIPETSEGDGLYIEPIN